MISELSTITKINECNRKLNQVFENTEYFSNISLTKSIIKEAFIKNNKEQKDWKERKKIIIIFNIPKPSTVPMKN